MYDVSLSVIKGHQLIKMPSERCANDLPYSGPSIQHFVEMHNILRGIHTRGIVRVCAERLFRSIDIPVRNWGSSQ